MTTYPTSAPCFADDGYMADVVGHASTADEALALYRSYFAGTGSDEVVGARKITPERKGEGPVDGWAPIFAA